MDDFFKKLLDNLYDGIYFVDTERNITYWNKGAERITGFSAKDVVGTRCHDNILMHVDEQGKSLCHSACPLTNCLKRATKHEQEIFLHHADGHRVPVLVRTTPLLNESGEVIGGIEIFSDNTELLAARHRIEELQTAAFEDPLTKVANRRMLEMRIDHALAEFKEGGPVMGVMFVDIDKLKTLNDTHGHLAADRILKTVADTLRGNLRATDMVARWGGDEFAILTVNIDEVGLTGLASKLRALVESSVFGRQNDRIKVTVSIGATLGKQDDTAARLMERVDKLLYESKAAGRNRVTIA